jgi:hypothetical protein
MPQSEVAKKICGAVNAADQGIQQFFKAFGLVKQLADGFKEMTKPEENKDGDK